MREVRTIQAKAAEKITRAAARNGVRPEALCRAAGLDPQVIGDSRRRVPFAIIVSLYEHGAALTG